MPLLSETPLPFCAHNECAYAHEVRRKRGWSGLFRHSLSLFPALLGLSAKAFRREETGKKPGQRIPWRSPSLTGEAGWGAPPGLPARRKVFA